MSDADAQRPHHYTCLPSDLRPVRLSLLWLLRAVGSLACSPSHFRWVSRYWDAAAVRCFHALWSSTGVSDLGTATTWFDSCSQSFCLTVCCLVMPASTASWVDLPWSVLWSTVGLRKKSCFFFFWKVFGCKYLWEETGVTVHSPNYATALLHSHTFVLCWVQSQSHWLMILLMPVFVRNVSVITSGKICQIYWLLVPLLHTLPRLSNHVNKGFILCLVFFYVTQTVWRCHTKSFTNISLLSRGISR